MSKKSKNRPVSVPENDFEINQRTLFEKLRLFSLSLCRGKRFFLLLLGIVLLAFILRLLVCLELFNTGAVQNPLIETDMATYKRLALEIRSGKFPEFFDYQPFYYCVFLPILFLFSPAGSPFLVMLAQCILAAAAVWLCGICAAQLFGRRAGCLAALLLALSQFHIFYTPYMLLEVLQSFWMILILYASLLAWRQNKLYQWVLLALFCSFSTLTRGNALLFVPGILFLCIYRNRDRALRATALCVIFLCLFYIPQLPFSWKNYQHFGRWRGPSCAQDKVLALGNSPEAAAGGLEYPRSYHHWVSQAEETDPAKRVSAMKNILLRLRYEPIVFLELKFRTFLLFWDRMEIPNNISFAHIAPRSKVLSFPLLLKFSLIGSLGLAGVFLCFLRLNINRAILLYAIIFYCASTVIFYMLARFRLACLPFLCVSAAGAIRMIWSAWSKRKVHRQPASQALLLLLLAVFMVNFAYAQYHQYLEPAFMRKFMPEGTALQFPDKYVFYDHGALSVGGTTFLQVSKDLQKLEKKFSIPTEIQEKIAGKEAVFLIRIHREAAVECKFQISHNNELINNCEIIQDRMVNWCKFSIPKLHIENNQVSINIYPEKVSEKCWLAFDQARNYDRTKIKLNSQEEQELTMELSAELEVEY